MSRRKEPSIPNDILDQLRLALTLRRHSVRTPARSLKKAFADRALNAEMDHHLDQEAQGANSRNGYGRKTVMTDGGRIEIEVPRDWAGSFDPQLIAKYQRRFPDFDDKIISMYARGMSTREITWHLRDLYGIDASLDLIGNRARWIQPIRWLSLMRSGSRCATMAWSAIMQSILPWELWPTAPKWSLDHGWNRMKAPNSGCAS